MCTTSCQPYSIHYV